jgi:hypothetical protein
MLKTKVFAPHVTSSPSAKFRAEPGNRRCVRISLLGRMPQWRRFVSLDRSLLSRIICLINSKSHGSVSRSRRITTAHRPSPRLRHGKQGGDHRKNAAARLILQLLATNFYRRWRRDDSLLRRSIVDGINHPLPAGMTILVHGKSCATAFPDFHLPVKIIRRNCEYYRDRSHDYHSAQHSHQK